MASDGENETQGGEAPSLNDLGLGRDNPESGASEELTETQVRDLMDFSPFDDQQGQDSASESDAGGSVGSEAGDAAGGEDAGVTRTEGPSEGESESGQQAADPEKEELRNQLTQLRDQVNQLMGAQQAQGQGQGQGQEQGQGSAIPAYDFNVPDKMMEMMDSADPTQRKQALAQMLKGTAQAVHQNVYNQFGQALQQLRQEIPQQAQQTMQQTSQVQQVNKDFFGTYPELNRTELQPMIQSVGQQVLQEFQQRGKRVDSWTPELRDEIGKRARQVLQTAAGSSGSAGPAQGQQNGNRNSGASAPPRQFGGGTRPNPGGSSEQEDIMRTIFG